MTSNNEKAHALTSSVVWQMMARFCNFCNVKKKSRLSLKRRSGFRTDAKIYLSNKIFWRYGHFKVLSTSKYTYFASFFNKLFPHRWIRALIVSVFTIMTSYLMTSHTHGPWSLSFNFIPLNISFERASKLSDFTCPIVYYLLTESEVITIRPRSEISL